MPKTFVLKSDHQPAKFKVDYRKELNEEQYKVVTEAEGPCLVLAGAGSGKTRTIVYRVAYLIEKGAKPENILLVTFTNKAAKEMLSRVSELIGTELKNIWGGTFHHIGNRLLRKYGKLLNYQANFSILDEEDSVALIKASMMELEIDFKKQRFPSARVLKDLISFAKNSGKSLAKVVAIKHPRWMNLISEITGVAKVYEARKKTANAMDFDDLLVNWLKLVKDFPQVKEKLAHQFRYILVDEYQDTNHLQAEIIKELASVHNNVLVVGDDAQSIYSFRAADIQNILDFPKIFPKTRIFKLEINYRSTPEILDLANEVIKQNANQFPKVLQPVVKSYLRPQLVPATSAAQEAEFISQMILQLREEGVAMDKVAVLFRAASHSQELEFALTQKDIPYDYRGGLRFFERAHIKDAIAYLRVINNPKDEVAWLRILTQQIGIGSQTAAALIRAFKEADCIVKIASSDFSELLSSKAKLGWENLRQIFLKNFQVAKLKDLKEPAQFIRALVKSDYQNYLEAVFPNWQERLDDLEQLAKFSENYQEVSGFLNEVTLQETFSVRGRQPEDQEQEKIVLSTIHQAKGLEWQAVFVINLVEAAFPNNRALAEENGLEEERRLFYVAITRAQQQLFLTYPLVDDYASRYLNSPSQFLKEIPTELMEEVKLVENGTTDYSSLNDDQIQYLPEV